MYSATDYDMIDSSIGKLYLLASDQGLHAVLYKKHITGKDLKKLKHSPRHKVLMQTKKELNEYFKGQRKEFGIKLHTEGTEFQKKAWKKLCTVPFGKTISYQEQAKRLGDSKKARAVGTANSQNPHSIIVPCHRVIAKSGKLSGYGGGVENKEFLLSHEKSLADD